VKLLPIELERRTAFITYSASCYNFLLTCSNFHTETRSTQRIKKDVEPV